MRCVLLALLLVTVMGLCQAEQEEAIQASDEGEGSRCDQDEKVAKICLACSALPFKAEVSLATCCSMETAFQFCDACVNDPSSCGRVMDEIDELRSYAEALEDYYDANDGDGDEDAAYDDSELYSDGEIDDTEDARQKRFGTLFMKSPKRYGRLLFGKRVPEKRYGRLYMGSGSYFGKRALSGTADYDDETDQSAFDKRFGYVLGSSYKLGKRGELSLPDKRYGQLLFGQNKWYGKRDSDDDVDAGDVDKRYGRLFVGNKGWFGKRSDDTVMDKRYGRLFVNGNGWFGKRSDDASDNAMDKRYGRLFVGGNGWFGKRSDEEKRSEVEKRFGRLFMGRRRGSWFG